MTYTLNSEEIQALALVPDPEIISLAADLSLIPDEEIDRRALLEALIPRLLALGRREGLPLSKYDAEDLSDLPVSHREALAKAMGWSTGVRSMLRSGRRVYKLYRKERTNSQVPLMLPILLPMVARCAYEGGG